MPKFDLYQHVTDKIIRAIEAGASGDDFAMPWTGAHFGQPFNATTNNPYNGVNVLLLWAEQEDTGYPTAEWASYKQWAAKDCQVKKGEHGTMIVFAGSFKPKDDPNKRPGEVTLDEIAPKRFLRYSRVFNAAQVEGWQSPVLERPNLAERIAHAEAFVANTGARIDFKQGRAFYSSGKDFIGMPAWDQFKDGEHRTATEAAYGVLLHELTHWTGHKSRCDRQLGNRFGGEAYAAEELIAEIGAAFLCAELGIEAETRADHAHYVANWLTVLQNDKKAIFTAASAATKAADYLRAQQVETAAAA